MRNENPKLWKGGLRALEDAWDAQSCRTVEGSLELQNGGLRALVDAWNDFLIEAFSV